MTADLVGRLREWADQNYWPDDGGSSALLREAADAIEQLTIYNSTNREIADRAERAEARLAAAEKMAEEEKYWAGEWEHRAKMLGWKPTEAYTGVPGVLSSDGKPARGDHPRQYVTPSRESPDVIAVSDGSTTGTADLKQDCLCCNDAGCLCCKRTDLNSEKQEGK